MKKFTLSIALFLAVNSFTAKADYIDSKTFKSLVSRCATSVAYETKPYMH